MKWFKRIGTALLALVALVAVGLGWLLGTTAGLRFALARAQGLTGGALVVQQAQGRLAGPLTLTGVRYRVRASGLVVDVGRVEADPTVTALLRGRVQLKELRVHQVDVALPASPATAKPAASKPLDLRAPIDLVLQDARVEGVRVHRGADNLFLADRLDLAAAWTRRGLAVRTLHLRAPDGRIDLEGQTAFVIGYRGRATVQFDWRAGGRRWSGRLKASSNGRSASASVDLTRPSTAHVQGTLSTRAAHDWKARLSVPRGAAAPWLGRTAIRQLALALQAHGDIQQAHVSGTIDLDDQRVQLVALDARRTPDGKALRLEHLQLRSPQHPGSLDASGRIDLSAATPTAQLHLGWQDVTLPAALAGRPLATHGTLQLDGTLQHYRAVLDAEAGPPGSLSKLQAALEGTPDALDIRSLAVVQPKGRLDTTGHLDFGAKGLDWQASATARAFDPGLLLAGWNGALDAKLSSQGRMAGKNVHAQLKLDALSGTLRGKRVDGHGTLALSPKKVLSGQLDLRYGAGRIALTGADGTRNDLDVHLHVGALGDWLPDAAGTLTARLRVRGAWPKLSASGTVEGKKLAWKRQRAGRLASSFDIPDIRHPGGTLKLTADDLHAAGFAFDKLTLDGHGTQSHHQLDIDARGDPLSLRLALRGGMQGSAWNGTLQRLDLGLKDQPTWHLRAPAALAWDGGKASLAPTCLEAGQPQLCISGQRTGNGALQARYRMRQLPLELVLALVGNDLPMRARGTLDGSGEVRRDAVGALSGQASLTSDQGTIFYVDRPNQPLLGFRQLDARLDLAPQQQRLRIGAQLQEHGRLDGDLQASGPQHALGGHLHMQLDNLRFVELFTPEVANLAGSMDADLDLSGTLAAPSLQGQASVKDVAGEIPALGLKLTGGQLRLRGDNAQALRVDGQVRSGPGTLNISGTLGIGKGQDTVLSVRGKNVQVANLPSASVNLSPDVGLQHDADGLHIAGVVGVDKADVQLEKLPGAGATQASPDVVVVDAGSPPAKRAAAMPVTTNLRVELGEHTHVNGYGLDGDLRGDLLVLGRPGKGTLGQGQIRIDGTFRAYGQDLRIEQGRLLFASTPLQDPGLDIQAIRKLNPNATIDEGQQVGLQVRGTARRPVLTVFSNPVMSQSDALSYLITGKPLSQVKGGEGNMVNSAAQALGSATGDLLAKNVGSRLGISDIGVSSSDTLGTTAFTVGKYLSPRLYLSYGVGLFEPGQVITLRYILSRRWNFEAQQSTNSSRASFNYRYEH